MSRYLRPIHKFITKPDRPKVVSINPVEWLLNIRRKMTYIPLKQRGSQRWEIFAQREITIKPKEMETLELGLGVRMTRGWCQVSLGQEIQASVLQGGGVVTENAEDIVITILNDSDSFVTIIERDPFCFVVHSVRIRPVSLKKCEGEGLTIITFESLIPSAVSMTSRNNTE